MVLRFLLWGRMLRRSLSKVLHSCEGVRLLLFLHGTVSSVRLVWLTRQAFVLSFRGLSSYG